MRKYIYIAGRKRVNEKEFQEQIISHIDYRMDQMERLELRSLES